jgi:hypothetical protein
MEQAAQPLDPRQALKALNDTEQATRSRMAPNSAFLYFLWGAVYLLGYGALHGGHFGWLPFSSGAAVVVFLSLLAAGAVVSAVHGVRTSTGFKGQSQTQGAYYGFTWFGAMLTVGFFSSALSRLELEWLVMGWLINSIAVLAVGLLFMVGGAMFKDRPMTLIGSWFLLVNIVCLIAGPNLFLILFGILGCAGLFAGGVVELARVRRSRAAC